MFRIAPRECLIFLALFSITMLSTIIAHPAYCAEQASATEQSRNGSLNIIAPLEEDFMATGTVMNVFGYKIEVSKTTRFENITTLIDNKYLFKKGTWVKIRAHRQADGTFVARKVRRIERRPLYIVIQEDELDPEIFTKEKGSPRQPLKTFMEDESKAVAFSIKPHDSIWFGGNYEISAQADKERDLNKKKQKDKSSAFTELRFDMIWRLSENGSFVLLEPAFNYVQEHVKQRDTITRSSQRLSRAYGFITLSDAFALNIGRQDFDEEREWIYDETLDGIRFYFYHDQLQMELSVSQGRDVLDEDNSTTGIKNTIADIRYFTDKKSFLGAWYVNRKDTTERDFNPTLYGIRSIANPSKGFRHWLDLAYAEGNAGSQTIKGYAVDMGLGYISKRKPRKYITFALAYASGPKNNAGNALFRQTGLHDNSDKFGGITSFKYYGEVVSPELSNLAIATIAIGTRPHANFSIDLAYHAYQQGEKSTELTDSRLKADPNGKSTDIGTALDLVLGYRHNKFSMDLILGRFEPGNAFDEQIASHIGELKLKYTF